MSGFFYRENFFITEGDEKMFLALMAVYGQKV